MRPVADSDATAAARRIASDRMAQALASATPPSPADGAPPADDAPRADDASRADDAPRADGAALPPVAKKPMKPIGPAALKALREAIRSGAYPSDAVVRDGIERLIRRGE